MATKPTRQQAQGRDNLAQALLLVTEAVRLDGRAPFTIVQLNDLAACLVKASSAFGLDEIVAVALEARGKALGMRSGTAELVLLDDAIRPLEVLLKNDDDFRTLITDLEEQLGEV